VWLHPVSSIPFTRLLKVLLNALSGIAYVDRTAALYKGDSRIRVGTKKGDQTMVPADQSSKYNLCRNPILLSKGVGMKDRVSAYLEMSLTRMWKK